MMLFIPGELETVKAMYRAVEASEHSEMTITFYCHEDHIVWDSDRSSWIDTDYTYAVGNGERKNTRYVMHVGDPSQKPGVQGTGTSYTTLGNVLFAGLPQSGVLSNHQSS